MYITYVVLSEATDIIFGTLRCTFRRYGYNIRYIPLYFPKVHYLVLSEVTDIILGTLPRCTFERYGYIRYITCVVLSEGTNIILGTLHCTFRRYGYNIRYITLYLQKVRI